MSGDKKMRHRLDAQQRKLIELTEKRNQAQRQCICTLKNKAGTPQVLLSAALCGAFVASSSRTKTTISTTLIQLGRHITPLLLK
ncbi:hypothetical protein [Celerinatantimonas sp. MCCC 1A17872]|uniref:hypothetical protein n=1 Tax=Celerinatantimonas sp. MCCC 1A17872 TaxID=3177514 RepID=UPI0038C9F101